MDIEARISELKCESANLFHDLDRVSVWSKPHIERRIGEIGKEIVALEKKRASAKENKTVCDIVEELTEFAARGFSKAEYACTGTWKLVLRGSGRLVAFQVGSTPETLIRGLALEVARLRQSNAPIMPATDAARNYIRDYLR